MINSKIEEKVKTAKALEKFANGGLLTYEELSLVGEYAEDNKIKLNNLNIDELAKEINKLNGSANTWQKGGLLFDSITGALGAGNVGGTIAQAAQPWVAKEIGDYFKNKNAQGSEGHLLAHAILGAAVAAAGGDNPFVGGLSGAGTEAAAPLLAKWLYGKDKKPEDLTAEEKSTITSIVSLVGAGIGGAIAGDRGAVAGADAARNATDNNKWVAIRNSEGAIRGYKYEAGACKEGEKDCLNDGEIYNTDGQINELLGDGWWRKDGRVICNLPDNSCVGEKPKDIEKDLWGVIINNQRMVNGL